MKSRLPARMKMGETASVGVAQEALDLKRQRQLAAVPLRFLRFDAVRERTGLSRTTIWRLERKGLFPRHRQISTNAVGWREDEIDAWMLSRTATG